MSIQTKNEPHIHTSIVVFDFNSNSFGVFQGTALMMQSHEGSIKYKLQRVKIRNMYYNNGKA